LINGFKVKRKMQGVSNRTVNLAMVAFKNVLRKGIDEGFLQRLPTENMRPLKHNSKKRALFSWVQIESVCASAMENSKNGLEFSNYIKLMAFCGSRMSETSRLKWTDVDWSQKQLTIGSDGLAKNHKSRTIDFNQKLESHLLGMFARRAPDSEFLFPSPQRGNKDRASKSYRETLKIARTAAHVPQFSFHDCRHFFISHAVMAGVDFMTIARFVGHSDGGILIGKVYGHLSNEHAKRQAQKITFEPIDLPVG
jgi:integrase